MLRKSSSFHFYELKLTIKELDYVLRELLPKYSTDTYLLKNASQVLATVSQELNQREKVRKNSLQDVTMVLESFIKASDSSVPNVALFEVLSLLGLVCQALGDHRHAIQSYMKSLWIASATDQFHQGRLACTLHRLAMAYAKSGDFQEAQVLLVRAVGLYRDIGLYQDHPCFAMARSDAERFQDLTHIFQDKSNVSSSKRRISFISEGSDHLTMERSTS